MNKRTVCGWCNKEIKGKTGFVFCCPEHAKEYNEWKVKHEKKWCAKNRVNKAYEEVKK